MQVPFLTFYIFSMTFPIHQLLSESRRHMQNDSQVRFGYPQDAELHLGQPSEIFSSRLRIRYFPALMPHTGTHVAIRDHDIPLLQLFFHLKGCFEAIKSVEVRRNIWTEVLCGSIFFVQILLHKIC